MAKTGFLSKENPLLVYFKETRAEINKVSWPTHQEALRLTLVVLAVTVFMAIVLGVLDYFFAQLMAWIILTL